MNATSLQQTANLQTLGQQVSATSKPLLLMFSQHHCPFCKKLKSEVLEPMLKNPVCLILHRMSRGTRRINICAKSMRFVSLNTSYELFPCTELFIEALRP
jgi:hypothetical protein